MSDLITNLIFLTLFFGFYFPDSYEKLLFYCRFHHRNPSVESYQNDRRKNSKILFDNYLISQFSILSIHFLFHKFHFDFEHLLYSGHFFQYSVVVSVMYTIFSDCSTSVHCESKTIIIRRYFIYLFDSIFIF